MNGSSYKPGWSTNGSAKKGDKKLLSCHSCGGNGHISKFCQGGKWSQLWRKRSHQQVLPRRYAFEGLIPSSGVFHQGGKLTAVREHQ